LDGTDQKQTNTLTLKFVAFDEIEIEGYDNFYLRTKYKYIADFINNKGKVTALTQEEGQPK